VVTLRAGVSKKAVRRRSATIHAYVGENGDGKTLAAVYDTLPDLEAGRRVLSNVEILDPATGDLHPLCELLTHPSQLLDFEDGSVVLDEMTGVAEARQHASMPPALLDLIVKLRKRDVPVRWTATDFTRADVGLRQVTQGVTHCRGFMGVPAARRLVDRVVLTGGEATSAVEAGEARWVLWPAKRLFRWRTYGARQWEAASQNRIQKGDLDVLCRQWFYRPGHVAELSYRTLDSTGMFEHLDDVGRCLRCGGVRRPQRCECVPSPPARSEARTAAVGRSAAVRNGGALARG
jgi:hypothetical protein